MEESREERQVSGRKQRNHNHSLKVTPTWSLMVNLWPQRRFPHSFEFPLESISLLQRCQLSGLVSPFSKYPEPSSNSSKTNEAFLWQGELVVVLFFFWQPFLFSSRAVSPAAGLSLSSLSTRKQPSPRVAVAPTRCQGRSCLL